MGKRKDVEGKLGDKGKREGVLKANSKAFCENTTLHGVSYWVSKGK